MDTINPGDTVEYIDACSIMVGKHPKTVKVAKQGIWDGTKVILNDKELTTIYKLEYLTKVKSEEEIIIEAATKYYEQYDNLPVIRFNAFIGGVKFYKEYLSLREAIKSLNDYNQP